MVQTMKDYAIGLLCGNGNAAAIGYDEITCEIVGENPTEVKLEIDGNQVKLIFPPKPGENADGEGNADNGDTPSTDAGAEEGADNGDDAADNGGDTAVEVPGTDDNTPADDAAGEE